MAITPLPPAPQVTDDTATFNTKAFAWVDSLDGFTTEFNAELPTINEAIPASEAAVAAANYKGEWSSLSGALNIPASVSNNGVVWVLKNNLADVTTSEPGVSADWISVSLPAPGTTGNVLTSDGANWTSSAPAGGGAWEYISSVTANNSATVEFTSNIDSTYDVYAISIINYLPVTNDTLLRIEVFDGGTWNTVSISLTSFFTNQIAGSLSNALASDMGNVEGTDNFCGTLYLFSPADTARYTVIGGNGAGRNQGDLNRSYVWGGTRQSTNAVTGIRFFSSSGNISKGTFRLYGLKNS